MSAASLSPSPEAKSFQCEHHDLALTSFHNTGCKHQPQKSHRHLQRGRKRDGILGPSPVSAEWPETSPQVSVSAPRPQNPTDRGLSANQSY